MWSSRLWRVSPYSICHNMWFYGGSLRKFSNLETLIVLAYFQCHWRGGMSNTFSWFSVPFTAWHIQNYIRIYCGRIHLFLLSDFLQYTFFSSIWEWEHSRIVLIEQQNSATNINPWCGTYHNKKSIILSDVYIAVLVCMYNSMKPWRVRISYFLGD